MKHDPAVVAAYVAGELTGGPHAAFEEHLLACQECWDEVEVGRFGRELVQHVYEAAPDDVRRRVMAEITNVISPRRVPKLAMAAAAACVAVLAVLVFVTVHRSSPVPVAAAVSGFQSERLPGARIPNNPAPDLSRMGFAETAAGAGDLGDVPVTAYAYRDQLGRRLLLYVGERPFATPRQAERYGDRNGSWLTQERGVSVLCSRTPHVTLVVAQDEKLVRAAAEFLDLT